MVLGLDFAVKINDSAAHLDPCHKLTGMKGLRQVVIGSGSQPLHNLFLIGVACQQDEVRRAVLEVPTDPSAKFQTSNVRHAPIGNHYSGTVFYKQIEGLAAVFRKQNLVPLSRKGMLDQSAGDRGIVNHKNLEW
jgi:hypothetical protein